MRRGLALLLDFSSSIGRRGRSPGVTLSGSAEPPSASGPAALADLTEILRRAEIAALVGAMESIRLLEAAIPRGGSLATLVLGYLDRMRADLVDRLHRDDAARRSAELADIVISAMQGTIRDGLLTDASGFAAIDELDFRDWLARHGARPETLDCSLIRGMYDLVFAYEDGDPERPRFPAGLGLFLAGKFFFEYSGSIFWRMQAGMGDVVFAPLYQALLGRGVRFALGHRVERLGLSSDRSRVDRIELTAHPSARDPLVRVKGLPCFPSPSAFAGGQPFVLSDFDDVVLATSLGAVPGLCGELLEDSPAWRAMAGGLHTVPTQSLQVWLREDEAGLGWPYPGATVSGFVTPFDTYASMSHLIPREDWPADDAPRALGYFCSVLPLAGASARPLVRANAERFLAHDVSQLWPGFRPELLNGEGLDSQYWRANVDPSERYVQALPGTGRLRLRADESGYENLFLAGDWIDCGLNAGCIEAAVLAGIQAANAVRGCPRGQGIVGSWLGVEAA